MRLEGKQKHFLRVVTAYRPVINTSHGPGTVQAQHERYLSSHDREEEPRAAFYTDLMQEVETWKSKGDQVIIGINANEDVRGRDTARIFAEMDMREGILEAHHDKSPPATCDKNTNREPIDGIFATPGIRIVAGGYSAFNSGCPSDHRYLWIDIPYEDAFGYAAPPLVPPSACRLKSKDLMMVQRYNSKVKLALTSEGLIEALETIKCQALAEGWSDELEKEYNRINGRQYAIQLHEEKKVRHLRMGGVVWSPKLQTYRTAIEIWSMLLKKRKGTRSISNRKL
jgi:hypothetical protein